jgi:hypothetical protein
MNLMIADCLFRDENRVNLSHWVAFSSFSLPRRGDIGAGVASGLGNCVYSAPYGAYRIYVYHYQSLGRRESRGDGNSGR